MVERCGFLLFKLYFFLFINRLFGALHFYIVKLKKTPIRQHDIMNELSLHNEHLFTFDFVGI